MTRDARRSFTRTQKNEILYQQNYLCAGDECGHDRLDPRNIHFHHIDPWCDQGGTITINGAALCSECHGLIHHKMRLSTQENTDEEPREEPTNPFNKNPFGDINPFNKNPFGDIKVNPNWLGNPFGKRRRR